MDLYPVDALGVWTGEVVQHIPKRPLAGKQIAPPELADGEFARWTGAGWQVLSAYPGVPKAQLLAYAAECRWQKEVGGITAGGVQVATDDRAKLMLSGARLAATADPDFTTRWKTPAGWVDLSAAQVIAISDAVLAHVAASFATESAVATDIMSGAITTREAVLAAFTD